MEILCRYEKVCNKLSGLDFSSNFELKDEGFNEICKCS